MTGQCGDAESSNVGEVDLGPGQYGGEAYFVPRSVDPGDCSGEDDGFLVTFVYDEVRNLTLHHG